MVDRQTPMKVEQETLVKTNGSTRLSLWCLGVHTICEYIFFPNFFFFEEEKTRETTKCWGDLFFANGLALSYWAKASTTSLAASQIQTMGLKYPSFVFRKKKHKKQGNLIRAKFKKKDIGCFRIYIYIHRG